MNTYWGRAGSLMTLVAGSALLLADCGTEPQDETITVRQKQYTVEPFEAYRDRALRIVDGRRLYQVEWDLF
jgi:hypothetical protein